MMHGRDAVSQFGITFAHFVQQNAVVSDTRM